MYKLKNLYSGYKNKIILKNITLEFSDLKGSLIALIGQNGGGKTTLLRVMSGLQKYSGSVLLNNREVKNYSRREFSKCVTFMMSTKNFNPVYPFTAREIISMGRMPYKNLFGRLNADDEKIINHVSEMLNVKKFLERNILELSDGERQLIFLASALVQNTDIIILDEPVSALDPDKSARVFKILSELAHSGKIIIAAVHDLNIAAAYSDFYIALNNGELISHGRTKNLNADILEKLYNAHFEKYFNNNNQDDVMWRVVPE